MSVKCIRAKAQRERGRRKEPENRRRRERGREKKRAERNKQKASTAQKMDGLYNGKYKNVEKGRAKDEHIMKI